jgi:DNA-binding winged helix-turn-helix (wHTH) protein
MPVRFADFTLDREQRLLTLGETTVPLTRKAFDLLDLLVSERPRVQSKERIRDQVWPKTFFSESTLNGLVAELRAALGDDAREPRYVRTVHGVGYAFAADVVEVANHRATAASAPPSRLLTARLLWENRLIPLSAGENVLGRDDDVGVRLDAPSVSRRHACIRIAAGEPATIEDLDSKNGTWLAGRRLAGQRENLQHGDLLRVGKVELVFLDSKEKGSTQTAVE